jgi:uncharacterized membrane protein YfcA
MMIPVILFLGMNPTELLFFQITQTLLDYVLVTCLIYVLLRKINPRAYKRRKLLITALGVEGVHIGSSFLWYFFVLYAIGGFIIELIFLIFVPYLVIYLLYTPYSSNSGRNSEKQNITTENQQRTLSTGKSFLVYLLGVVPALILSCTLTSVFFNLAGIENTFIFA